MSRRQLAFQPYNCLQAYSFHLIDVDTGAQIGDVITPDTPEQWADKRKRYTLTGLITLILIAAVKVGTIPRGDEYDVTVAAHFTPADLPAFRDFGPLMAKGKLNALRKTYTQTSESQAVIRQTRIRGIGTNVKIRIRIRDTMLLTPAGMKSLAAVGDALGIPKVSVSRDMMARISVLRKTDPETFHAYALRDAEIAAVYANRMRLFARDVLDLPDVVPVTLSSVGVAAMEAELKRHGLTVNEMTGKDAAGYATHGLIATDGLAVNAYSGGRNECFHVGPTIEGIKLYDVDLSGAYPAGMASIQTPDWDNARACNDLKLIAQTGQLGMSFACVEFEFPKSTRFPSLPARIHNNADAGLFFPRRGTSYATGAEIVVALDAGARVTVKHGVLIPWANEFRPFVATSKMFAAIRAANKGDALNGKTDAERQYMTLIERAAKEAANSIYGQLARGVAGLRLDTRPITSLNLQTGEREELGPSKITSPAMAAWTTGFCRAAVSELLHRLPHDGHVISVTTDGLLSSVPVEALDTSGPMMSAFLAMRRLLDPDDPPITTKHSAERAFSIRTRGVLSIDGDRTEKPLFARAGNRVSENERVWLDDEFDGPTPRAWAENDLWLEHAATRKYSTAKTRPRFRTQAEQWRLGGADLTRSSLPVRVAMCFDHKRKLTAPVCEWRGCFGASSEPWETVEDAEVHRAAFKTWREGGERVLRTVEDLADFLRFAESYNPKTRGRTAKVDPFHKLIRKAVALGLWGFPPLKRGPGKPLPGDWTARLASGFLTVCGVKTTTKQIEHASRGTPPEIDMSGDPRTHEILARLKRHLKISRATSTSTGDLDQTSENTGEIGGYDVNPRNSLMGGERKGGINSLAQPRPPDIPKK